MHTTTKRYANKNILMCTQILTPGRAPPVIIAATAPAIVVITAATAATAAIAAAAAAVATSAAAVATSAAAAVCQPEIQGQLLANMLPNIMSSETNSAGNQYNHREHVPLESSATAARISSGDRNRGIRGGAHSRRRRLGDRHCALPPSVLQ